MVGVKGCWSQGVGWWGQRGRDGGIGGGGSRR